VGQLVPAFYIFHNIREPEKVTVISFASSQIPEISGI